MTDSSLAVSQGFFVPTRQRTAGMLVILSMIVTIKYI